MTRIEKWYLYREEIKNENILISELNKNNTIINTYKEKINAINNYILIDEEKNKIIAAIECDKQQLLNKLKIIDDFYHTIDETTALKIDQEMQEIKDSFATNNLLNDKNEINVECLNNDNEYATYKMFNAKINELKNVKFENTDSAKTIKKNQFDFEKEYEALDKINLPNKLFFNSHKKIFVFFLILLTCIVILNVVIIVVLSIYE